MAGFADSDYIRHDATSLAGLVRSGAVQADALLDAAVARLDRVNGQLNAVIALHVERARQKARAQANNTCFRGVPLLIKGLFTDLAGTVGENGSNFVPQAPAVSSSTIVERYEAAGFLIFGRTHSPEFGGTSTSESRRFGVTRNPFDLSRTAGGSSGGAAAAVAAGIVPVAHASDAGGSIIIPAACCGLFGLKPSRGRVPLGPDRIEGAAGLATQHVLTRSVRDSAALLDLECAGETVAVIAPPKPEAGFLASLDRPGRRLRVALFHRSVHGLEPVQECREVLENTAALCATLGHKITPVELPLSVEGFVEAERVLRLSSVAATIRALSEKIGRPPGEEDLEPATWQRYRAGLEISGIDVLAARETMLRSSLSVQRLMERYDVLLSPAMADLAPFPGKVSLDRTDEKSAFRNRHYTTYAGLYNWTGQPSMSVPLGKTAHGLPVGVLFAGRYGEEALLLTLAAELERACPWTGLAPDIIFRGEAPDTQNQKE